MDELLFDGALGNMRFRSTAMSLPSAPWFLPSGHERKAYSYPFRIRIRLRVRKFHNTTILSLTSIAKAPRRGNRHIYLDLKDR
jgi:hypothetical protein